MSIKRNDRILKAQFFRFLAPTVLSMMAMSLNEFVDSLLVSNLINADAMTLVNLASPLVTFYGVIYSLLGIGGSAVYAIYAGRHNTDRANSIFSVTVFAALTTALITLVAGLILLEPLSSSMCKDAQLLPGFIPYVRGLVIAVLFIIPLQIIVYFMPAFGHPGLGSAINITANVINLIMDYVYIKICGMGLAGAAYATLTGYAAGIIIVAVLYIIKKIDLPFSSITSRSFRILAETSSVGLPSAMNQIGYCIKIAFVNAIAFELAQMAGVTAFAVCMQAVSMVSVITGGVIDAMVPMAASLYGQRDFSGIRQVLRISVIAQFIANFAFFLFFEIYPRIVLDMYKVTEDIAPISITGLRIFSISFLFRGFVLIYMCFYPVIKRQAYAFVISLIDGFAGIIPLSLILTRFRGINGLWEAFAVLPALMLLGILTINSIISVRSQGRYSKLFLIEKEDVNIPVFDSTVGINAKDISVLSDNIQGFCHEHGLGPKLSMLAALVAEEMSAYTMEKREETKLDSIDIILKIYPEYILIDLRSIGKPYDPTTAPEANDYSSITVLRKTASSLEYNYTLGMNQTRIKVNR